MLLKLIVPISGFRARHIHTTLINNLKDYYEILGIARNASPKEIKEAYYDKAKTYHPDVNKGSSGAIRFQEISEAYEILGDTAKRRAYDTTIGMGSAYGQHIHRSREFKSDTAGIFREKGGEPINMNHIHHVYRTINRQEQEEPRFRPFEDHCYPGTDFNRFEYARHWNQDNRAWVYTKRADIREYHRKMNSSSQILKLCLAVFTAGCLLMVFNYRYLLKSLSNQSARKSDDIARDRAGMYVIRDKDMP